MRLSGFSAQSNFSPPASAVWVISADTLLTLDLERIWQGLGFRLQADSGGADVLLALEALEDSAILLLDVRMDCIARLLSAVHESGSRKRCAIALIAEQASDEWIARLREGVIDDIVPRNADYATWNKHLSSMRRGHQLLCELEDLRAATLMEVQHDALTGVFTRETMLRLLFRETDRVQRLRGALGFIVFDIDDFAHWNAKLGREACDRLLREVSARTGRLLRSYDLLGRLGADEFLMALPGCSNVNAVLLAERLRMEVFGELFPVETESRKVQVRLTASFGIAASHGRSPVVVLRQAEQAMALARQSGPDTIRSAETVSDPVHILSQAGMLA
jgi:diguanylate cyclase (GGDEF)-like protein